MRCEFVPGNDPDIYVQIMWTFKQNSRSLENSFVL